MINKSSHQDVSKVQKKKVQLICLCKKKNRSQEACRTLLNIMAKYLIRILSTGAK